MNFSTWMPVVKTLMQEVHTAAVTAKYVQNAGFVYSYDEWPGTPAGFPATFLGVTRGSTEYGSEGGITHHELRIRLLMPGISLAEAQKMLHPFIKLVRDKFAANLKLLSAGVPTVDHILPPEPPADFYEGPGMMQYGESQYPGIVFIYDVKEVEATTVSA